MGKVSDKEAREIARESVGKYPVGKPPAVIKAVPTGLSAREREQVSIKQPVEKISKRPQTLSEIITERQAARDKQRAQRQQEAKQAARTKSPFEMSPQSVYEAKKMQEIKNKQTRQMLIDLGLMPDDTGRTEFRPKSQTVQNMIQRELQTISDRKARREAKDAVNSAIAQWNASKTGSTTSKQPPVQNPVNEPGTRAWIEEQVSKNLKEIAEREKAARAASKPAPRGGALGGGMAGNFGGSLIDQVK
jgi:hypothetical protein